MIELTPDQKVQIEIELIKLQAKNIITDEQLRSITRVLFNIEWTEEDEAYERRATTPRTTASDVESPTT